MQNSSPYTQARQDLCQTEALTQETMPRKNSSSSPAQTGADRADAFAAAFLGLKHVFAPHVKYLHVNTDTRGRYYLETRSPSYKGKPLFFGAVISGRIHVSFHLMPLYWDSSLREKISVPLKKRMQGKSCFNFTAPDPTLFRELATLTAAGLALYRSKNLL
jgi:hypothetical protein